MAQKPPQGKDAAAVADEALRVRTEIDLSGFGNQLQNEAARLITDYSQRGLSGKALGDAVAADLEQLFDARAERSGREATHEAFAQGRNLEAQQQPDAIGEVVRSAILDTNTCQPCINRDGNVYELNTPAYFDDMPPNHCEGGEQCRCLYIYRVA